MSGHSVSDAAGARAVLHGKLTADYAGTRVYEYEGGHYFVPEKLWKAVEEAPAREWEPHRGTPRQSWRDPKEAGIDWK